MGKPRVSCVLLRILAGGCAILCVSLTPLSKSSPIDVQQTAVEDDHTTDWMDMSVCPNFNRLEKGRSPACDRHEIEMLEMRPFSHQPKPAKLGESPCAWEFVCHKDVLHSSERSNKTNALWWEAVLKSPAQNERNRKSCRTRRGEGECVPLRKHEVVVRYPTSESGKACFYWRRVKTAYYCNVTTPSRPSC